ncbi:67531e17-9ecc-4c4a-854d-46103099912f [Thermothielavioides terrestris]|uniref:67531e17-9ecc-4c4a-854d-46103099912f n=1 Tax=Thermothielavioides terrestris TaxID=2587410 RepID=A0A3S4C271_9PEZI|nr:67531e17-9ecc-4c4a-854d-46103099912f [Thermothielavioides terrestris]
MFTPAPAAHRSGCTSTTFNSIAARPGARGTVSRLWENKTAGGGTRKPGFPVVGGGECDTESSSVGDVLGTYGVIVPLVDPVTASMP